MLSGLKIAEEITKGNISISDFTEKRLNPNSYNLTLSKTMVVYDELVLDCKKDNRTTEFDLPEKGYVLYPGKLYLGSTNEWTETKNFVPAIEGRSSLGRLGLCIHVTAGFGDVGFKGYWTLELAVIQPLRIYPNMEIAQIAYHPIEGDFNAYSGKYQGNRGCESSKLYRELN